MTEVSIQRKLAAEALGTGLLVTAVVGSGIMAAMLAGGPAKLADGNTAIALLCNTIPTGAILVVLITILGPISGAHFNPAVSVVMALRGSIGWSLALLYMAAQIAGGCLGTLVAHGMFDLPIFQVSATARTGIPQWFAEFVATFGLIGTILGCVRFRPDMVAGCVGLYITSAYWFTASTSFANPAVTIARAITTTFAGIAPLDVAGFIVAQIAGAIAGLYLFAWLFDPNAKKA